METPKRNKLIFIERNVPKKLTKNQYKTYSLKLAVNDFLTDLIWSFHKVLGEKCYVLKGIIYGQKRKKY